MARTNRIDRPGNSGRWRRPQPDRGADRRARGDTIDVNGDRFADLHLDRGKAGCASSAASRAISSGAMMPTTGPITGTLSAARPPSSAAIGAPSSGFEIVQRDVDRGLGPDAALEDRRDPLCGQLARIGRRADQRGRDVARDGALDLLGEFSGLPGGAHTTSAWPRSRRDPRSGAGSPSDASPPGLGNSEHPRPGDRDGNRLDADDPRHGHAYFFSSSASIFL
jgi:hypothetical protein